MKVIDIHTHGVGGYETRGASVRDILQMAAIQGSNGIDAVVPTIYPGPPHRMRADMTAVKEAMKQQKGEPGPHDGTSVQAVKTATILGVNLEGPFLNPACAGALDGAFLLPAAISHWERLVEGFEDVIRVVTIAPELDGAAALVKMISDAGIIVSMGHSEATFSEAKAAFNAGAKGITHLFNAMRGFHHREPGIAGFGLVNPHVYVEVIADPFHLHRKTLELIFRVKDPSRVIIVSDSVKETKTGDYSRGIADSTGRPRGGSMTIVESARNLVECGFEKAVVEGCIRSNPERYLGRS